MYKKTIIILLFSFLGTIVNAQKSIRGTIYEITELNYEYNKRQVPLNNIKDFIKVKGPFLAETHIYAIDYKNEMFKLLTTSSKYTKANEVLAALKNNLKENL